MKFLTNLYKSEEITEIKKSLRFSSTSYHWKQSGCKTLKNAGNCAEAAKNFIKDCEKLNKPATLLEWEQYYYSNVKTFDEFENLAKKWQKYLNDRYIEIDFDTAFLFTWIRIIYDTFNGVTINEYNIRKKLQKEFDNVRPATEKEDVEYKIDIVVNETTFYQVKPITFIRGLHSKNLKADLKEDFFDIIKSHKKLLNDLNLKEDSIKWIAYDDCNFEKLYYFEEADLFKLYEEIGG